ncbi:MAG: hypothetical protein ACOCQY_03280 [Halorhabdus sp.]
MSVEDAETDEQTAAESRTESESESEPAEEQNEATDSAEETATDETPVPVGVKLGSTRTVIAKPGADGALETSQTLTCLATYDDAISGEEQIIYGEDAAEQYPDRVQFMLRSGLPEDERGAELTERFFKSVIEANDVPENSGVVYAIPTIENERGLANLESVVEESAIGKHFTQSYPESLCGAIPAIGDGLEAINEIFIAVNMGSTNLEAAAYRRGEQLKPFSTGAVTGNEVDRMIANNVESETQGRVNVDTQTAREYKERHADFENFEPFTDVIQQPGGGAHEFTIERSVMDAVDAYLDEVVEEFANTFLPELANEHMRIYQLALEQPVVLTGGMACVPGIVDEFAERVTEALNREVEAVAPENPDLAATVGAQRIADRLIQP